MKQKGAAGTASKRGLDASDHLGTLAQTQAWRYESATGFQGGAMPIRREHRFFYPIDWPQLSAVIRFRRAGERCEACQCPHKHTSGISATAAGGTLRRPLGAMAQGG